MTKNLWRIAEKPRHKNATGRGRIEPIGSVDTFETYEAAKADFDLRKLSCSEYEIISIPHDGSDQVRR